MDDLSAQREEMVERHLAARGITAPGVLEAMAEVPRERFVDPSLVEFAYEDSPLPIDAGQTISQPYIVALMAQALELGEEDRVLEVGTGSGYAAAVLSRIAAAVYTVERHEALAETARRRLEELGYGNVHVRHGDGTRGWPEHAPYDAIAVAAGGPEVPAPLVRQLAPGGRLIVPVGETHRLQELVRMRRKGEETFEREELGGVRFVPLVGEAGWSEGANAPPSRAPRPGTEPGAGPSRGPAETGEPRTLPERIAAVAEPFPDVDGIESRHLAPLLDRVGDARVVLLGEATHGTSEFYRMRTRITRALVEHKGFDLVAVEADWPDAAAVDRYVRAVPGPPPTERPFQRFPTWMWANEEVLELVHWLRRHNERRPSPDPSHSVGFYGLDLYSLFSSIEAVVGYLEEVDPDAARLARERYGCLSPWQGDAATYGRAALSGRYRECENEVIAMLQDLMNKRLEYAAQDGHRFLDAAQNARLIANAERYYRIMYYGSRQSWNLRDRHMFETLESLLEFRGPRSKAVVWEHNSHIGDASATEMGARGEHNVGQLCREAHGADAYLVGFGTDHGTVAAASDWGGELEVKSVRPAHERSYEHLCHESGEGRFLLPLRPPRPPGGGDGPPAAPGSSLRDRVRRELMDPRLERAIGVIYRPETELQSHYFQAVLPRQFDELCWFDETSAVTPLGREAGEGLPDTFPFGV